MNLLLAAVHMDPSWILSSFLFWILLHSTKSAYIQQFREPPSRHLSHCSDGNQPQRSSIPCQNRSICRQSGWILAREDTYLLGRSNLAGEIDISPEKAYSSPGDLDGWFFCTAKCQSKARLSERLWAPFFFLARDKDRNRYYVHWNQTGHHSMIQQKE